MGGILFELGTYCSSYKTNSCDLYRPFQEPSSLRSATMESPKPRHDAGSCITSPFLLTGKRARIRAAEFLMSITTGLLPCDQGCMTCDADLYPLPPPRTASPSVHHTYRVMTVSQRALFFQTGILHPVFFTLTPSSK
jgi:hypothetical protein